MNQYEAAYQDLKPVPPIEEIDTPDERHFFPVQVKHRVVYEVIYGPKDYQSVFVSTWDEAYVAAKSLAKSTGYPIHIQVTEDKEYTVG